MAQVTSASILSEFSLIWPQRLPAAAALRWIFIWEAVRVAPLPSYRRELESEIISGDSLRCMHSLSWQGWNHQPECTHLKEKGSSKLTQVHCEWGRRIRELVRWLLLKWKIIKWWIYQGSSWVFLELISSGVVGVHGQISLVLPLLPLAISCNLAFEASFFAAASVHETWMEGNYSNTDPRD